jgi:hypothetical protein
VSFGLAYATVLLKLAPFAHLLLLASCGSWQSAIGVSTAEFMVQPFIINFAKSEQYQAYVNFIRLNSMSVDTTRSKTGRRTPASLS